MCHIHNQGPCHLQVGKSQEPVCSPQARGTCFQHSVSSTGPEACRRLAVITIHISQPLKTGSPGSEQNPNPSRERPRRRGQRQSWACREAALLHQDFRSALELKGKNWLLKARVVIAGGTKPNEASLCLQPSALAFFNSSFPKHPETGQRWRNWGGEGASV